MIFSNGVVFNVKVEHVGKVSSIPICVNCTMLGVVRILVLMREEVRCSVATPSTRFSLKWAQDPI